MAKQILNEELRRMQLLAGVITESQLNEAVEVPTWLKGKLEDVHTKPGQGSIFSKLIDSVLKLAQDTLDKSKDIDKIANSTGTLTVKSPGIGYNLVLPIEQAKKLRGAKESEVEKIEGPNKIKVPAITTTAPLTQFKSDELTVIVRPKKDESGIVIPNEYIVLSAFPGDPNIPRASEWNGKYAIIIPGEKDVTESIKKMPSDLNKEFRRMQLLAGVITESKYKAQINEEEYTLHLKNNHPNVNLDKKIKIDFKPTTMFGKWDEEELEQLFAQEKITSGTDIELIDSDGKVIKKGKMTGWSKDTPIITENEYRQLKPEKYTAIPIPTEYKYRLIYMYSDKPEYQIFLKEEPKDENLQAFLKIAPKPMEEGDGIMVLDNNNKMINHAMLSKKEISWAGQPKPGELSPMTV